MNVQEYESLSFEGKINYWAGGILVAIGGGKFRDAIALMVDYISREAYARGFAEGKALKEQNHG